MNNKKKTILSVLALVIVALLIISLTTYAYWQITRKQTRRNRIGTACLKLTMSNESGDIDLLNMYPMSEQEMMDETKYTPYSFTVENTCDDAYVKYTVALESIEDPELESDDYLNYNYVRVKLDDLGSALYGGLEALPNDTNTNTNPVVAERYVLRDTKKIVTRKLKPKTSRTHYLRLWLDENTPLEEVINAGTENEQTITNIEKYFLSKVKIIAGQGVEEDCYAVSEQGELYAYDPDCGTSATIPATVKGNRVKSIATGAFKNVVPVFGYQAPSGSGLVRHINDIVTDFAEESCPTDDPNEVTPPACEIDVGIAFTQRILPLVFEEETDEPIVPRLSDIYAVVYNTDTESSKYEHIEEAIFPLLAQYAELLGLDISNIEGPEDITSTNFPRIYYVGGDEALPDESDIGMMAYLPIYYDSSEEAWVANTELTGARMYMDDEYGLAITDLDLSQATYLEKIEPIAFSNLLDLNKVDLATADLEHDSKPGLLSLTFGNNAAAIELGGGAFGYASLDTLNIYNTVHMKALPKIEDTSLSRLKDKNDFYGLYGAFFMTEINNLHIKQSGASTEVHTDTYHNQVVAPLLLLSGNDMKDITVGVFGGDFGLSLNNIQGIGGAHNVTFDNAITSIGAGAFTMFGMESLTLPTSLTSIGERAFSYYYGESNTVLNIPNNVTTIGDEAFGKYIGKINVSNTLAASASDWAPNATINP